MQKQDFLQALSSKMAPVKITNAGLSNSHIIIIWFSDSGNLMCRCISLLTQLIHFPQPFV